MADNNAWDRNSRRGNLQPRAATAREANPVGSVRSAGGEGNNTPREAKRKAGLSGQKEKQRKEIENPERTRKTPEEGGQNMAHEEQPQGRQDQRPEEGARGQWRVDTKDLQEGWETIKEIDKVLGHLEGRLDKVTAVIRQVAVRVRRRRGWRVIRRIHRRTGGSRAQEQPGGAQNSGRSEASA